MAGVDGVRDRWLVAIVHGPGHVEWAVEPDAGAVLACTRSCRAVGVDVPIGLPAAGRRRSCDEAAKKRLGSAASSVFFTPPQEVVHCDGGYGAACEIAHRVTGQAISRQTWGIVAKIRDWDRAELGGHVVEVHPEVSFRAMAGGSDFARKRSARGAGQRAAALCSTVDVLAALAGAPEEAATDDALDALAAAWSARRWAAGQAEVLGGEADSRGRPMRMVV